MSSFESCEHKPLATATKSTTVATKSSSEANDTSIMNETTKTDGKTLNSKERRALRRAKEREEATKSSTEATDTTMTNGPTDAGQNATGALKAAKASKTSSKGKAKVEKVKKQAVAPFISFTTRESRDKYSALPDGSIVENVGSAQKYVCHLDDLGEIEGFRTFTHQVPYETRTTKYSHVVFVSTDETPMKQQVLGIMYFHKNLKTEFAPDAEKWLKMMKEGVRIFMTDDGFTTVDPIKKKRKAKAMAKAKAKAKAKVKTTKPVEDAKPAHVATEEVVDEADKFVEVAKPAFVAAPIPKVNAWSKPVDTVPVVDAADTETDSEESGTEDGVFEPEKVQREASADAYDGAWQMAGKPVKKAPKYFICMERGFSLKVTYGDDGRPSIVQMKPDGTSTVIGWTSEMQARGFKHLRTPEGHHMFFKNPHLKVPLMIQCLDYTVKNSTDADQIARAREVLSWKKKFIIKTSSGELEWAKTFKASAAAEPVVTKEKPPSVTDEAFPVLGSA